MILDQSLKLEAVLAGAVSANQPKVHVDYVDYNAEGNPLPPTPFRVALNSGTDVTILAAPTGNTQRRDPIRVSIYNEDTASITVTVKTDDSTDERIIHKETLLTLESVHFEKGQGWYALDANGNRKEVTGSTFSSATVTGNLTYQGSVLGAWTTPAFDAANFTGNASMTWTVASGDVTTYAYTITGKTMTVAFSIATTTVGGTPDNTLQIKIPAGKTATKGMQNAAALIIDSGTRTTGRVFVAAAATVIGISRTDDAAYTAAADTTTVQGEITFEID
jgi:hypothetical protein